MARNSLQCRSGQTYGRPAREPAKSHELSQTLLRGADLANDPVELTPIGLNSARLAGSRCHRDPQVEPELLREEVRVTCEAARSRRARPGRRGAPYRARSRCPSACTTPVRLANGARYRACRQDAASRSTCAAPHATASAVTNPRWRSSLGSSSVSLPAYSCRGTEASVSLAFANRWPCRRDLRRVPRRGRRVVRDPARPSRATSPSRAHRSSC